MGREEPLIKRLARSRGGFGRDHQGRNGSVPPAQSYTPPPYSMQQVRSSSQPAPLQRAPGPKGSYQQQVQHRSPSTMDVPSAVRSRPLFPTSVSQPDLTAPRQSSASPYSSRCQSPVSSASLLLSPLPASPCPSPVPTLSPLVLSRAPTPTSSYAPHSAPCLNQPDVVSSIYVAPVDVYHE